MSASRRALMYLSLVSMLVLSACGSGGGGSSSGGGGNGGGSSGGGTAAETAVGFWGGKTSIIDDVSKKQLTIAGTILDDGQYWFLLDRDGQILWLINGKGSASNNVFTPSSSPRNTLLGGNYVAKTSWNGAGTITAPSLGLNGQYANTMSYDPEYDSPPAFSIAGSNWVSTLPLSSDFQPFTTTIASNGALSGSAADGCTFNGQLTLRPGTARIYNATVTFGGATCPPLLRDGNPGQFSGIAEPTGILNPRPGQKGERVILKAVDNGSQLLGLVILIDR